MPSGVKALCERKIEEYTRRAEESLAQVSVPTNRKQELQALMEALMHRES